MNTKREIVSLHNVIKNYGHGKIITKALREINLKILEGDFLAMMGPSGSGKSTLLNIIGGLDRTTSGEVNFNGKDFNTLSNKALSIIRRNHIGFVFQNYNLLPVLTAYENAEYVLMLQEIPISQRKEKVMHFFKEMGLDGLENRLPRELSGGQQQRVAIARAVVSDPLLVLADEITANVDSETAQSLLLLMEKLNKINKTTFLISTHDPEVIKFAKLIGYKTIISHRSGDSEDTFIADFAVGTDSNQIKTGSLSRSERVSKYNQLLRIEHNLGKKSKMHNIN